MDKTEVLHLIAEMRTKASTPHERQYYDGMAVGLITQEIEPLRMATSLDAYIGRHWLDRIP